VVTVQQNADGSCCSDWSATPTSGAANQYDDMPLVLVRDDRWIMRQATQATEVPCQFGLSAVSHLDATEPATPAVGTGDGEREPTSLSALVGGSVVAVRPRTLFVDHVDRRLMEWYDEDGDGTADDDEQRVVFSGVYDFQVAFGYDGAPENGRLVEGPSTTDEWLGNVAADALPAGTRDDHLRMVSFGVVTGVRFVDAPVRTERAFNGPTLTTTGALQGVLLRKGVGHAMLRNLLVFF